MHYRYLRDLISFMIPIGPCQPVYRSQLAPPHPQGRGLERVPTLPDALQFSKMTSIPDSFVKYGYTFQLVKRSPKAAIYSQSKGDKLFAYEVHRIRTRKAGKQFGKPTPALEYLPSERDCGVYGKTYSASLCNRDEARTRSEAQFTSWSGFGAKAA